MLPILQHIMGSTPSLSWSPRIDAETLLESFIWYSIQLEQEFKLEKPAMETFAKRAVWQAKYSNLSLDRFLNHHDVRGIRRDRLEAELPEEAYPRTDRPRDYAGDVQRVYDLMKTKCTSPVVVIRHPTDTNAWLFLDGTHRLIAAKLTRAKIRVCWIS